MAGVRGLMMVMKTPARASRAAVPLICRGPNVRVSSDTLHFSIKIGHDTVTTPRCIKILHHCLIWFNWFKFQKAVKAWDWTLCLINFIILSESFILIVSRYGGENSTTAEEISGFQHIFLKCSWLLPGRTSGHQNLSPIPMVFTSGKIVISQLSTYGYWSEFLVAGCPSLHQPVRIREETLESGNIFSNSWILASVNMINKTNCLS